MSALLLLLLLIAAASPAASSPTSAHSRVRRRSDIPALQGGIPLGNIFALCESDGGDIGPCLAQILTGVINKARPSFASGLEINGDVIVLEPFPLDDVEPEKEDTFQVSITSPKVHGISTLHINNITFSPEALALNLSFDNITITGDVMLKFLFIRADVRVRLELSQPGVGVKANWALDMNPDEPSRLDIVISNATADFILNDLKASVSKLHHLGDFIEKFVNANSATLVKLFILGLERSVSEEINRKQYRISLGKIGEFDGKISVSPDAAGGLMY